jgi:hypothetical protein
MASLAQTPARNAGSDGGTDLLAPTLDNTPPNPPPLLPPGEAALRNSRSLPRYTAQSRIGATRIYGSPSGFGAGDTGFD